jgi:hypothetical protein
MGLLLVSRRDSTYIYYYQVEAASEGTDTRENDGADASIGMGGQILLSKETSFSWGVLSIGSIIFTSIRSFDLDIAPYESDHRTSAIPRNEDSARFRGPSDTGISRTTPSSPLTQTPDPLGLHATCGVE